MFEVATANEIRVARCLSLSESAVGIVKNISDDIERIRPNLSLGKATQRSSARGARWRSS